MKRMKRLGRMVLSFMIMLAMVVGLMPGLGLTAYADSEQSETIATNTNQTTYTGEHYKVSVVANYDTGEIRLNAGSSYTAIIEALNGEIIDKIVLTASVNGQNAPYVSSTSGNVSGSYGTATITDVNATSVTLSTQYSGTQIGISQVQVYSKVAVANVSIAPSTAQTIDVGNKVSFTATVAPNNASDKTVKWSVGGTNADAVTLYSDEACETAVTLDTATSTLTVYAKGISAGSATVTCTSNADSTKSANCDVTVNAVASYPLWVGGVQVTSANKDDVLGNTDEGATVSYDVGTNTLTLNGADIAAGYTDPTYNDTSGIYYSGNDSLSIVLSTDSDNKVGVTGNVQIGIKSSRNITISGAGKLTVKGSGNYSVGINAYSLTIEAAEVNVEGALNGIQTQKYGYGVNIISGKVNAIGQTGIGIHSGLRDANNQTSAVTIGENATVVAIGGNKAINYLKNAIAGTGWTDPEDNTSKTTISISSEGQSIDTLKKMAFPELPASTVTTAPEANDLTFTGSSQELVTAGVASDGEMQYAIGTNTTTVPTTGWSASIPTTVGAGTYYVWYKAVGNANHTDSEASCVTVIIREKSTPPSTPSTPSTPTVSTTEAPAQAVDYTVPVKNDDTVNVGVKITDDTAVLNEITDADIDKIINTSGNASKDASSNASVESKPINIDLSGATGSITSLEISKTTLNVISEAISDSSNSVDSLKVTMSETTVSFDKEATASLAKQAEGDKVKLVVDSISEDKLSPAQKVALANKTVVNTFEAYVECNGKRISSFGKGTATVEKKMNVTAGRDVKHYYMVYLNPVGIIERLVSYMLGGKLCGIMKHFSEYAVVYDENVTNETGVAGVDPSVPVVPDTPASSDASANPSTEPANTTKDVNLNDETAITSNGKTVYDNGLAINSGLKISQTKSKISVAWGKVSGASKYEVYVGYCGKSYDKKPITTTKNSCTITKIGGKKLNLKKNYKIYVVAYKTVDGKNYKLAKTVTGHIVGRKNKKYSNPKAIKLTKSSATLSVGKTTNIKAKVTLINKKRKSLTDAHAPLFRYASDNKSIATVDSKGKVTAVAAGTCNIYVYAKNGYAKKFKVTVK